MKKSTMIVCVVIGVLLIIAGRGAGSTNGFDSENTETVGKFDLAGIASIQVEVQGLDVRVYDGWNKAIEVGVSASAKKNVQVWQQDDTLYVRQKGGSGRGQIDIWLPKGGQGTLSVLSNSGEVRVSGIRASDMDVELATVSGAISVYGTRMNYLNASTTSGELYLGEVEVYGPLELNTVSGYLNCYDIETQDINIGSVSGDIFVSDAIAEYIQVRTTSGDVNISDIDTTDVIVQTTSGDMWLTLPGAEDDYSVTLSTVSGHIEGVRERVVGEGNLALSSVSGDIKVTFEE